MLKVLYGIHINIVKPQGDFIENYYLNQKTCGIM
jgi:hypothetical protein